MKAHHFLSASRTLFAWAVASLLVSIISGIAAVNIQTSLEDFTSERLAHSLTAAVFSAAFLLTAAVLAVASRALRALQDYLDAEQ